jgi:putative transposase
MMQQEGFSIADACMGARLSRAGFYRHYEEHEPRQANVDLRDAIQKICLENRCYGYRRVTALLQQRDWVVNRKRVARLMRADNLLALRKHRYVLTTDSRHPFPIYPNLVPRLVVNGINQLWVADITYIRLREAFLFLAVILDAYSRKAVGWGLNDTLEARLALAALDHALAHRQVGSNLVHHSDRGAQYGSGAYVERLQSRGIQISMSRAGNPYDNAKAESFMKTLKCEEVYLHHYRDREHVEASIARFVDEVYNETRLHSALGYLSPTQFEAQLLVERGAESASRSVSL